MNTDKQMTEENKLKEAAILTAFIKAIKEEFSDQNWDYLDFIAERVLANWQKEQSRVDVEGLREKFIEAWHKGCGNKSENIPLWDRVFNEFLPYLKQEESKEAVEFADWVVTKAFKNNRGIWESPISKGSLTTAELYQLFKKATSTK